MRTKTDIMMSMKSTLCTVLAAFQLVLVSSQGINLDFHEPQLKHAFQQKLYQNIGDISPEFNSSMLQNLQVEVLNTIEDVVNRFLTDQTYSENNTSCYNDLAVFYSDLLHKEGYTFQVLDSLGKLPSGFLQGNQLWLGDYDQCLSIVSSSKNDSVHYRYNLLQLKIASVVLSYGVCAPDTCSGETLYNLTENVLDLLHHPGNASVIKVYSSEEAPIVARDIVALIVTGLLVGLCAIGTLIDLLQRLQNTLQKHTTKGILSPLHATRDNADEYVASDAMSVGDHDVDGVSNGQASQDESMLILRSSSPQSKCTELKCCDSEGLPFRLLIAFSWISNGEKILNTSSRAGSISCLNGMRVLSMSWVIIGHTYSGVAMIAANPLSMMDIIKGFFYQAIMNATVSVDTFFFLSGFLVAYLTLKELQRTEGKLNWVMFYFHRFWRLTPAYMFILLFFITLYVRMPDGPLVVTMGNDNVAITVCYSNWWTNLLYINNFYPDPAVGMCMGWSWYLANDMQFYVISPLFVYLLYRNWRAGIAVTLAVLIASLAATGAVSKHYDLVAGLQMKQMPPEQQKWSIYIYNYSCFRIAPYLVGILLGYILHHTKNGIKMPKVVVTAGWALATAVALAVLYGLYGANHSGTPLSGDLGAFYIATNRFAWSLSLAWVVFACVQGYGGPVNKLLSLPLWTPLARLTYCTYLTHIMILYTVILTTRQPMYFTNVIMVTYCVAFVVGSYALGFITSLLVEAPMMTLEKVLLRNK